MKIDRQTNRHTYTHTHRQTHIHTDTHTDIHTHIHTDTQAEIQTHTQTNSQAGNQLENLKIWSYLLCFGDDRNRSCRISDDRHFTEICPFPGVRKRMVKKKKKN